MENYKGKSNISKLKKMLTNIVGENSYNNPIEHIEDMLKDYKVIGGPEEKIKNYESLFESILIEVRKSNISKLKKILANIVGENPYNKPIEHIEDMLKDYKVIGGPEEKIKNYESLFESILIEIKKHNSNE